MSKVIKIEARRKIHYAAIVARFKRKQKFFAYV